MAVKIPVHYPITSSIKNTNIKALILFLFVCINNDLVTKIKNSPPGSNVIKLNNIVAIDNVAKNVKCDTTIHYDLDDISSEGAGVEACYVAKTLHKAKISIYGAGGRSDIYYLFNKDVIKVIERNYVYLKPLSEVKKDTDIKLSDITFYYLGISKANFIKGKSNNKAVEIFKIFKNKIPFHLN